MREIVNSADHEDRGQHPGGDRSDTASRQVLLRLLKLFRDRGIAQRFGVEINQMKPDAVLHLAFTQIAQTGRPLPGMQIIRHVWERRMC